MENRNQTFKRDRTGTSSGIHRQSMQVNIHPQGGVVQMSELDVFHRYIPQISELIVICQEMNRKEYEDWKIETMKVVPVEAIGFMKKVLILVSAFRTEKDG